MRIEEIAISNFRGIKNQTIVFDGKSTVFLVLTGLENQQSYVQLMLCFLGSFRKLFYLDINKQLI